MWGVQLLPVVAGTGRYVTRYTAIFSHFYYGISRSIREIAREATPTRSRAHWLAPQPMGAPYTTHTTPQARAMASSSSVEPALWPPSQHPSSTHGTATAAVQATARGFCSAPTSLEQLLLRARRDEESNSIARRGYRRGVGRGSFYRLPE